MCVAEISLEINSITTKPPTKPHNEESATGLSALDSELGEYIDKTKRVQEGLRVVKVLNVELSNEIAASKEFFDRALTRALELADFVDAHELKTKIENRLVSRRQA